MCETIHTIIRLYGSPACPEVALICLRRPSDSTVSFTPTFSDVHYSMALVQGNANIKHLHASHHNQHDGQERTIVRWPFQRLFRNRSHLQRFINRIGHHRLTANSRTDSSVSLSAPPTPPIPSLPPMESENNVTTVSIPSIHPPPRPPVEGVLRHPPLRISLKLHPTQRFLLSPLYFRVHPRIHQTVSPSLQ